jgi:ABC-type sugar transport system substrate-binding protein/AraC-like DNA-binding protein
MKPLANRFCAVSIYSVLFYMLLTGCMPQTNTKRFKIGFAQCTNNDSWRKTMLQEMQRELSFYQDMSLQMTDAGNDSRKQVDQINDFIAAGVDLLIVSPNEAEPITPVVEKSFNKGVPVIIVDRRTTSGFYTAYVGANNKEIGETAGMYAASILRGKGNMVEIQGLAGSSPARDRHQGFLKGIREYPDMQVTEVINGKWEKDTAALEIPKYDAQLRQADVVFAHNDVMALAAYEYCQRQGFADRLKFIGVDGLPGPAGGIQWVADGVLDATLLYPTGGEEAIRVAAQILHHAPYQKENNLSTTVITPANVRVLKMETDKILSTQAAIERQEEKIRDQIQIYHDQQVLIYILFASLLVSLTSVIFLLKNRRARRSRIVLPEADLQKEGKLAEPPAMAVSGTKTYTAEQKFVTDFTALISKHLSDPDFGVPQICRSLGLSRVQLYRKVKSNLGSGISDYILQQRLELAKHLLTSEPDRSVAEVAYASGFSSPSYFSTVFKAKFNCSPSDWRV